ncbi:MULTISPECIES: siderophore ABC transporter substrate-binding protein [unclassified Actinotalea]|uniref:siderophore ABC transporter substrate-binding protein n=1 Tax=unclassified Actinotalea TaxID=2638618 RepID=UPI0015F48E19|nr:MULTISPECIES: siderophore ABC transporter substrate-binding protein [unclassified Actinotalea]
MTSQRHPRARRAGLALTLVSAFALTACAGDAQDVEPAADAAVTAQEAPSEVTVTHAQGETTVPVNPETVLTFDLATLDTLSELGVEVDGLPKSNLPGHLAEFDTDDVLDIGTLFEPDYEAVNAAEPDLIIVAGRSAEALPELEKIAPTIDLSNDWADFRGSVEANAEILGQVFDKEDEVAELVADLDADIEAAREVTAEAGTGLIVMTAGGEVTAYGPGSRFGFLHDELGMTPAIEDVEAATHGEAVSFEFLAEANPDWLVVIDRDAAVGESGAAAEQVLDNELVAGTTAWSQDQVVYVDSVDWYIVNGGLGTLSRMVDEISTALAG